MFFKRMIDWKKVVSNDRNDLSKRELKDIDKEINDINVYLNNVKELEVENIYDKLTTLISGHYRTTYNIKPKGVFRARKNNEIDEFQRVNQLWYPDWNLIDIKFHKYGRCNNVGQSVFYCSTDLSTTIVEIRPNKDDLITTVDYGPANGMEEISTITNPIGINYLKKLEYYSDIFTNDTHNKSDILYQKNFKLDEYLNSKFHEIIEEEENFKYKITYAVSKILMNGFDCLIYPSISYKMKGANLVFKPGFVDNNIVIRDAYIWKVKSVLNDTIELEPFKQLHKIIFPDKNYKNGIIEWRNLPKERIETLKIKY